MKILVAYASAKGTTQAFAERIHSRLTSAAVGDVAIQSIDKNTSLANVDVLIVGSCIHAGSWLGAARHFLKANSAELKVHPRPTWAFSVGMPPKGGERAEEVKMEKWIRERVDLRGHTLLQGRWRGEDMPWVLRWVFRCFKVEDDDRRDWEAVDAWAGKIAEELRGEEGRGREESGGGA